METINSLIRKKRNLKLHAEREGKALIYNRGLGGYQISSGFTCSEIEYPARTSCNKLILSDRQLERLASYI